VPGLEEASRYRTDELHVKKGADGRWRFSVNVYAYFYPEEHYLATFVSSINALNQSERSQITAEYFYQDIVGATTGEKSATIVYHGKQYHYRIQHFALRISSGDSISIAVGAVPADIYQHAPIFTSVDSGVDHIIASLRMLLRAKKQGGV
jgi:hypothetical protein